ncbi:hypothetical protein [Thermus altitudinis]|uniref:hypothetical protein n=1 Tax=Thermus altitudinis TaxID=2908145 RepID=UPI001FA96ED2|nr:hypothetical protein [Thermus altitudinis]
MRLLFDGAGTQELAALASPSHKAHALFLSVRSCIQGACAYCAQAFGMKEALKALGIPFLGEYRTGITPA